MNFFGFFFFWFLHEVLQPKRHLIAQRVKAEKFTSFKVMISHLISHSGIPSEIPGVL